MTRAGRQPRARRSTSRSAVAARPDLASRLRLRQATLRRQLSRADVLAEVIRAVNATLDSERVAEALVARVADWLPATGWLLLAGDDQTEPRTMASRGLTPAMEGAAGAAAQFVLRTGEPFECADLSTDRRVSAVERVAVIGFPLLCRGRTLGALIGVDRRPSARPPRVGTALPALQAAIEPGAIALDNALRIGRAEALSVTDDLTSLYNARYLSQVLRREVKRATRTGRPLSLLFIDLDGFKSINDSHGHLFGSRALIEAAELIRSSARETDVGARYGGDEFALVLPDTGTEGALAVGERLRQRIAAHGFLQPWGLDVRLTASVGVATLPDAATTVEGLIQSADKAMYQVKDQGKNGIQVALQI